MSNEPNAIITDQKGRALEVKRLSRRESMRLMRGWGTGCNVEAWLGNALLAASCRGIDGVPIPLPSAPERVEDLVDRLDDAGIDAIAEWITAQSEAAPNAAAEIEAAKK